MTPLHTICLLFNIRYRSPAPAILDIVVSKAWNVVNDCKIFRQTRNNGMSSDPLTPSVSWAQRPKIVFVTINVSDVNNPDIKVRNQKKDYTNY